MRIGVFGGTFDPPHIGHAILASEAVEQLALDRLLWVLAERPPHKREESIGSPIQDRIDMTQSVVDRDPRYELSCVDIERPGPHYTVDTIRVLKEKNGGCCDLFFLIGEDSLQDMHCWYHPGEILDQLKGLGVMHRPGYEADLDAIDTKLPGIKEKVHLIQAPLLQISSLDIRERIRIGRTYRYFLIEPVYQIIRERKLYH